MSLVEIIRCVSDVRVDKYGKIKERRIRIPNLVKKILNNKKILDKKILDNKKS